MSIYDRPRRTGAVQGQTLVKSVHHVNQDTGNISMTYEEWDMIYHDEIVYLAVHLPNKKPIFVEITDGMKNSTWVCTWKGCMIMSYQAVANKTAA